MGSEAVNDLNARRLLVIRRPGRAPPTMVRRTPHVVGALAATDECHRHLLQVIGGIEQTDVGPDGEMAVADACVIQCNPRSLRNLLSVAAAAPTMRG
jgi:hypothetical protein